MRKIAKKQNKLKKISSVNSSNNLAKLPMFQLMEAEKQQL